MFASSDFLSSIYPLFFDITGFQVANIIKLLRSPRYREEAWETTQTDKILNQVVFRAYDMLMGPAARPQETHRTKIPAEITNNCFPMPLMLHTHPIKEKKSL